VHHVWLVKLFGIVKYFHSEVHRYHVGHVRNFTMSQCIVLSGGEWPVVLQIFTARIHVLPADLYRFELAGNLHLIDARLLGSNKLFVCVNQVTKLVKSDELSVHDRQLVFEAIGFKFLARLLRTGKNFSLNNVFVLCW